MKRRQDAQKVHTVHAKGAGNLITATEAVRLVPLVTRQTLLSWAKAGLVKSTVTPTGRRFFDRDYIVEILESSSGSASA